MRLGACMVLLGCVATQGCAGTNLPLRREITGPQGSVEISVRLWDSYLLTSHYLQLQVDAMGSGGRVMVQRKVYSIDELEERGADSRIRKIDPNFFHSNGVTKFHEIRAFENNIPFQGLSFDLVRRPGVGPDFGLNLYSELIELDQASSMAYISLPYTQEGIVLGARP